LIARGQEIIITTMNEGKDKGKENGKEKKRGSDKLGWLLYSILGLILLMAVYAVYEVLSFYDVNFAGKDNVMYSKWGTFGDYFGGVLNPILSFLALIALLLTIVLQSRELRLSREELEKSTDALEKQSETLKIQNFESTFFHMIRLHNDIVHDIDLKNADGTTSTGRDCFKTFYNRFKRKYRDLSDSQRISQSGPIEVAYEEFLSSTQSDVDHYFSNLYTIILYVNNSTILDKMKYTDIIRSQLSSYEILLLFYYALTTYSEASLKILIERYEFLEKINVDLLLNPKEEYLYYDKKAYGNQLINIHTKLNID
jgi:uncharacterized membrane protein